MLTLVEPINMSGLSDRPHLGCAMLIAACREKGIKTTLVNGQTRYLKDMFVNDSKELWGLARDLKEDGPEKTGIPEYGRIFEYGRSVKEKGLKQFRDELKGLYQDVIIDKNPRRYFNARMITKLGNLHDIFMGIYFYYLKESNYGGLKIIDHYVSEIIKTNPRYAGFSLGEQFDPLSRIIRRRIKEVSDIPIIVGGSLTPFIDLKKLDKIFEEECFDYLVIGAGDHALPSLIEVLENRKEPEGIENVFYRKDGRIRGNDLRAIDDLDGLPYPDYSQFDLDLYLAPKRILPLQTARGCSWKKCAFCTHHNIYFGTYRTFGIEKVIETVKHLQDTYNCGHFVFHDEELPARRAKKISKAISDSCLKDISIYTYARFTKGYDSDELLSHLRKAGFSTFAWGMESGCQRVLDLMDKGTRISTMSRILKKSSKNGIANLCFIFFGFPGETRKEARQTVEFLKRNAAYIEDIIIDLFTLYQHSPLGRDPGKWNVEVGKDDGYSVKSGLSPEEAGAFFDRFSVEFGINSAKVTSDKLKYLSPGHNRRMLHFLNSSHGLLSKTVLLKHLKKGRMDGIFPIILGEVKNKGARTVFSPVNINETAYINRYLPVKEMALDDLKKKIFILSDGRSSMKDIILIVCRDFEGRHGEEFIYKKCADFFQDIFSKNWGLGFARSWRSS